MKQIKYAPGMKFNMLTLIEPTGEIRNGCKVWKCLCDCGQYTEVTTGNIKTTKSCGCLRGKNKINIKPGDRFGKLVVLEEVPERDKKRRIHYKCLCDCGNITTPRASDLKSGNTKSCGICTPFWDYIKYTDLTGQHFGKLTAISPVLDKQDKCYENRVGRSMFWICECECGNVIKISANHLTQGLSKSCGCQLGKTSQAEEEIESLLITNNIVFRKEVSFDDLKRKAKLRFDFGIYDKDNCLRRLIEFDGEHHYKDINLFQSSEYFKINDTLKNNYCKNNKIPLVRIPYYERGKITLDLILGDKYLI